MLAALAGRRQPQRAVRQRDVGCIGRDRVDARATEVVHAEELGHIARARVANDLLAGAALAHAARLEHRDAIPERQCLARRVRDIDRAARQRRQQAAKLDADGPLGRDIERRQRLIEQQQARLEHQRARERDPLLLAAGQVARRSIRELGDADALQCSRRSLGDLGARAPQCVQSECHVARGAQVREQRVVLGDEPDRARGRGPHAPALEPRLAIELDAAAVRALEPREQPEQRRLAGSALADHDVDRTLRHVERHVEREPAESLKQSCGEHASGSRPNRKVPSAGRTTGRTP